ncbi:MAG TPA: hypothetical protein VFV33_23790, partial [Gemmatimonadaceae bacterium]|nr:hypothetical protein [Gemmatimonadaceae bacterium]
LGVFGATLLGGMQHFHFGPARSLRPEVTALAAVAWFVAGSFPSLPWRPAFLAAGAGGVGLLAYWAGRRPFVADQSNRRFEVPLLVSAAPAYATYLIALTVAPLLGGVDAWRVGIGFPGVAAEWTKVEILRFLEQVAAFTLLGYMVAEYRGRVVTSYREALPRLLSWGVTAALLGEGVRGFHAGHGASGTRAVVLLTAALYGGWLYYLQRAHVVRLLSRPVTTTVPDMSGESTGSPRDRRVDAA